MQPFCIMRKLNYQDYEGDMAKAQLKKIESYAAKLNDMIHPEDELEAWVQAKLSVVAAYMGDIKHYLDYELEKVGETTEKWEVEKEEVEEEEFKPYKRGGTTDTDSMYRVKPSSAVEDMLEARAYVGEKIWKTYSRQEKKDAVGYLKAQGRIGHYGMEESIENMSGMQYEFADGGQMGNGGMVFSRNGIVTHIKDATGKLVTEFFISGYGGGYYNYDRQKESYSNGYGVLRHKEMLNLPKMAKGGKLIGKQANLDMNKNGKLDKEDFQILRGKKMADGGEVRQSSIDYAAKRMADNPNWTNEKLSEGYNKLKFDLSELNAGYLKPSKVIGGGYKSSAVAKRLAKAWLEDRIDEYKKALEIRGVMADGGMMEDGGEIRRFDRHQQMDDDTRGEILDTINEFYLIDGFRNLQNYLYGLFDGYDYSQTDRFKDTMKELNVKHKALHDRIEKIYNKIDGYSFEKYADGRMMGNGGMAKLPNSSEGRMDKLIQILNEMSESQLDMVYDKYDIQGDLAFWVNRLPNNKVENVLRYSMSVLNDKATNKYADGGMFREGGEVYRLGDTWSSIFDYDGMLRMALKAKTSWGVKKLDKLSDSLRDVNYHTVNRPLGEAIEALEKDMPNVADIKMEEFHEAVKKEMAKN